MLIPFLWAIHSSGGRQTSAVGSKLLDLYAVTPDSADPKYPYLLYGAPGHKVWAHLPQPADRFRGNNNPIGTWLDDDALWVSDEDEPVVFAYNHNGQAMSERDIVLNTEDGNENASGLWGHDKWIYVPDNKAGKIFVYEKRDGTPVRNRTILARAQGIEDLRDIAGDPQHNDWLYVVSGLGKVHALSLRHYLERRQSAPATGFDSFRYGGGFVASRGFESLGMWANEERFVGIQKAGSDLELLYYGSGRSGLLVDRLLDPPDQNGARAASVTDPVDLDVVGGNAAYIADRHDRSLRGWRLRSSETNGNRWPERDWTDLQNEATPLKPSDAAVGVIPSGEEIMFVIDGASLRTYQYTDGVRATQPLSSGRIVGAENLDDCCVEFVPAANANDRSTLYIYQLATTVPRNSPGTFSMRRFRSEIGGGGDYSPSGSVIELRREGDYVHGVKIKGSKGYVLWGNDKEVWEYDLPSWDNGTMLFRATESIRARGLENHGDYWYVGSQDPVSRRGIEQYGLTFVARHYHENGYKSAIRCYTESRQVAGTATDGKLVSTGTNAKTLTLTGSEFNPYSVSTYGANAYLFDLNKKGEVQRATYANDAYGDFATYLSRSDEGEGVTKGGWVDEKHIWILDAEEGMIYAYDEDLQVRDSVYDIEVGQGTGAIAGHNDIIWVSDLRTRQEAPEWSEANYTGKRTEITREEKTYYLDNDTLSIFATKESIDPLYEHRTQSDLGGRDNPFYHNGADGEGLYLLGADGNKTYVARWSEKEKQGNLRYQLYDNQIPYYFGGRRGRLVRDKRDPSKFISEFQEYSKLVVRAYNKNSGEREESLDIFIDDFPHEMWVLDMYTDGVTMQLLLGPIDKEVTVHIGTYNIGTGKLEGNRYPSPVDATNRKLLPVGFAYHEAAGKYLVCNNLNDSPVAHLETHDDATFITGLGAKDIESNYYTYGLARKGETLFQATRDKGILAAFSLGNGERLPGEDRQISLLAEGLSSLDGVVIIPEDDLLYCLDGDAKSILAWSFDAQVRAPSRDLGVGTELLESAGNNNPRWMGRIGDLLLVGDTVKNKIFAYNRKTKKHVPTSDIDALDYALSGFAVNDITLWAGREASTEIDAYSLLRHGDEHKRLLMEVDGIKNLNGIAVSRDYMWLAPKGGHDATAFRRHNYDTQPIINQPFNTTNQDGLHTLRNSGQSMGGLAFVERLKGHWFLTFIDTAAKQVDGILFRNNTFVTSGSGWLYMNRGPSIVTTQFGGDGANRIDQGVQALQATESVVYGKRIFGISSGRYFFDIEVGADKDLEPDYDPFAAGESAETISENALHVISHRRHEAIKTRGHIAFDGRNVMLVNAHQVHLYDLETRQIRRIDGPDYADEEGRYPPRKAWVDCTWIDGYFILLAADGTFHHSLLDSPTFDQLDYDIAGTSPDDAVRVVGFRRRIYIFGRDSIELWINTGGSSGSTFAFRRDTSDALPFGCIAPDSLAYGENGIFFLASDGTVKTIGGGHSSISISTEVVEEDIKKCKVEKTLAHYYMDEGHPFYSMTLTMQDDSKVCWVFDAKTALWHNRSLNNITAVTTFGGETLIGLDNDDAIHASRLSFGTDADTSIRRIAQSPILFEDLKRLRIEHVEIDIPNPQSMGFEDSDTIMLEWSDDEGRTWNAVSTKRLNQPRLRWNRMGQTREGRLLRMTVNSNKPILILGTYLQASAGSI